jgi:hypothetical protein
MLFPSLKLKRAARTHFGWRKLRKTQLTERELRIYRVTRDIVAGRNT